MADVVTVNGSTTALATTFATYHSAVYVENLSNQDLFVRADGVAAVADANLCYVIYPGDNIILNNGFGFYWQGFGTNPGTSVSCIFASAPTPTSYNIQIVGL